MHWIREAGHEVSDAPEANELPEITDLDELQTFVGNKRHKIWIWTAVNHKQAGWHFGVGHWRSSVRRPSSPCGTSSAAGNVSGMSRMAGRYIRCSLSRVTTWVRKTYMTRVEGENTRLRHYLARLHRKTLCYSLVS